MTVNTVPGDTWNVSIAFPLALWPFDLVFQEFQGASKPAPEHLATKEMFDPTTFVPREKALSCAVCCHVLYRAVCVAFDIL